MDLFNIKFNIQLLGCEIEIWGGGIDRFHDHVFISFATGKLEGGSLFFVYLCGVCVCVCVRPCVSVSVLVCPPHPPF